MKHARCVTVIVAALGFAALGGCSLLSEQHPTTESRYMTATEQQYWNDRQMRWDKAAYWSEELERQRSVRMARLWGY